MAYGAGGDIQTAATIAAANNMQSELIEKIGHIKQDFSCLSHILTLEGMSQGNPLFLYNFKNSSIFDDRGKYNRCYEVSNKEMLLPVMGEDFCIEFIIPHWTCSFRANLEIRESAKKIKNYLNKNLKVLSVNIKYGEGEAEFFLINPSQS